MNREEITEIFPERRTVQGFVCGFFESLKYLSGSSFRVFRDSLYGHCVSRAIYIHRQGIYFVAFRKTSRAS